MKAWLLTENVDGIPVVKLPMNPMLLPKTKSPFKLPVVTYWSASSLNKRDTLLNYSIGYIIISFTHFVKHPEYLRRSQKETAMHPSTLRI
jgi:hypothetical protein